MKENFLNSTISFLKKYNNYSDKEEKMLRYGLEGLYLTITKSIIILLLAFHLGILKEIVLVIFLVNIIRYFGFGFHAEKSYECLIFSILCFVFIPLILINTDLSLECNVNISIFCIINYLIYAPADTIKRPLPNKRKRLIRKNLTVFVGLIYTFVIVLVNNSYFSSLVLSAMIVEVILINPLTYKLFRQPYKNYKYLKRT